MGNHPPNADIRRPSVELGPDGTAARPERASKRDQTAESVLRVAAWISDLIPDRYESAMMRSYLDKYLKVIRIPD